jgi:hypothetical protein
LVSKLVCKDNDLLNPISDEEYWRQIDYEQDCGFPHICDEDAERANSKKPVSLSVHPGIQWVSDTATYGLV